MHPFCVHWCSYYWALFSFRLIATHTGSAWHISGGEGASANTSCLRVLVIHDDGSQTVEEVKDDLGVDKKDTAEIIRRLESQGILDIKKIELAH